MTLENLTQLSKQDQRLETAAKKCLLTSQAVAPAGLLNKILARLAQEQNAAAIRKLKYQLAGSLVFFAGAVSSLVLSVKLSLLGEGTSIKFLSLVFTDFTSVLHNWQDFSLSVLETLPLGTMIFSLGALLGSMLFGEFLINRWRSFRDLQHSRQTL